MKRLYYLFRDTRQARAISEDLHTAGVEDGQMHFLADDPDSLQRVGINTVPVSQERELHWRGLHGAATGLGVGMGVLLMLYLTVPDPGAHMNLMMLVFVCSAFALFGAWVGSMAVMFRDNLLLARFARSMDRGDTLLVLDLRSPQQESRARDIMHARHREARFEGEDEAR